MQSPSLVLVTHWQSHRSMCVTSQQNGLSLAPSSVMLIFLGVLMQAGLELTILLSQPHEC
jgi:hypothetical protein